MPQGSEINYWNSMSIEATSGTSSPWSSTAWMLSGDSLESDVFLDPPIDDDVHVYVLYNWLGSIPSSASLYKPPKFEMLGRLSDSGQIIVGSWWGFKNGSVTYDWSSFNDNGFYNLLLTWSGTSDVQSYSSNSRTFANYGVTNVTAKSAVQSNNNSNGIVFYDLAYSGSGSATKYCDWIRMEVFFEGPPTAYNPDAVTGTTISTQNGIDSNGVNYADGIYGY